MKKLWSYATLPIVAVCFLIYLLIAFMLKKDYITDIYDVTDNFKLFVEKWLYWEYYDNM